MKEIKVIIDYTDGIYCALIDGANGFIHYSESIIQLKTSLLDAIKEYIAISGNGNFEVGEVLYNAVSNDSVYEFLYTERVFINLKIECLSH